MEIKVGIQYVNREVVVDTDESAADVEKSFADAVVERLGAHPHRQPRPPGHDPGRQDRLPRARRGERPPGRLRQPLSGGVSAGTPPHAPGAGATRCALAGRLRAGGPSRRIRAAWFSISRENVRLTATTSTPSAPMSSAVRPARSTATRCAWLSASPTRRRPHRASRPATRGSASMPARTCSTTKSSWRGVGQHLVDQRPRRRVDRAPRPRRRSRRRSRCRRRPTSGPRASPSAGCGRGSRRTPGGTGAIASIRSAPSSASRSRTRSRWSTWRPAIVASVTLSARVGRPGPVLREPLEGGQRPVRDRAEQVDRARPQLRLGAPTAGGARSRGSRVVGHGRQPSEGLRRRPAG